MPSPSNKPFIFVASAQITGDASSSLPIHSECETVDQILTPYKAQGGCEYLLSAHNTDVYIEDVLISKEAKESLAIAHLIGNVSDVAKFKFDSPSGIEQIATDAIAEIMGSFPQLQLVIISGFRHQSFVKDLLTSHVPAVLSLPAEYQPAKVVEEFYYHLLEGKSLRKTFEDINSDWELDLFFHEVELTEKNELTWEHKEYQTKEPIFTQGLTINKRKAKVLNWRLRNPLLIPITEKNELKKSAELRKTARPAIVRKDNVVENKPQVPLKKPIAKKEKATSVENIELVSDPAIKQEVIAKTPIGKKRPSTAKVSPKRRTTLKKKSTQSPPKKIITDKKDLDKDAIDSPKTEVKKKPATLPKTNRKSTTEPPVTLPKKESTPTIDEPELKELSKNKVLPKTKEPSKTSGDEKKSLPKLKDLPTTPKEVDEKKRVDTVNKVPKRKPEKKKTDEPVADESFKEVPLREEKNAVKLEEELYSNVPGKPASRPSNRGLRGKNTKRKRPPRKPDNLNGSGSSKSTSSKPKISKRNLLVGGGIIALVATIIAGVFLFPDVARKAKGFVFNDDSSEVLKDPFPKDGNYHVMVLPFHQYPGCLQANDSYKNRLVKYLNAMGAEQGISVSAGYFEVGNCEEIGSMTQTLTNTFNADLLIWGRFAFDNQTQENTLEVHTYSTNKLGENLFLAGMSHWNEDDRTNISNRIPNLIYWANGVKDMNGENFPDAIKSFKRIEANTQEEESAIYLMLNQCYNRSGQHGKAQANYEQMIALNPTDPKPYYERGSLYAQLGEHVLAQADFDKVIELESDNINALISRGLLFSDMEDYDRALADFDAVIKQNPEFSPLYCSRAQVYVKLNEYKKAMSDYDRAIEIAPNYGAAYYGRGLLKQKMGRYQDAITDVNEALRIDPDDKEANLFSGDLHVGKGEYDRALNAFTKIIDKTPSPEAYQKRGYVYRLLTDYGKANVDFTAAIEMNDRFEPAYFERGVSYQLSEDFQGALVDFDRVIALNPAKTKAYIHRGEVLGELKRFDEAKESFDKAISLNPRQADGYYRRGMLLLKIGEYEEAIADVNEAIRINPKGPEAYVYRGLLQKELGDKNKARLDFDKALRLNRQFANAYFHRGVLNYQDGQLNKAQADFVKAIQYKTDESGAYIFMANIYNDKGEYEKALESFSDAIRLKPGDASIYYGRADYYLRFNRYEEALADLNRAIKMSPPEDANIFLKRGNLHARLNNDNLALIDYNKAIRAYPDSVSPYCQRGLLYQKMGNITKATEDFDKAIAINPNVAVVYYCRGILYQEMDDYTKSISQYNRAIELSPKYADAYNKRGEVYFILEKFDRSIQDFNRAIQIDKENSEAYKNRGDLAKKAGDFERALRDYTTAIKYDPYQAESYYNRGFIFAMQEKYDQAVPDIQKSLELSPEDGLRYGFLAKIYAKLDQEELFYKNIELALKNDYPTMELNYDPAYKDFQSDQRFQNLIKTYQK